MKKPFFACLLAVSAAAPALADQGCIEVSTTSVTTTVCSQFDCVQQADDSCIMWSCNKTQTSRYTDTNSSGCTRIANCGSRAVFSAGEPSQPDTDSTEVCDWYPCVQADPATKGRVCSVGLWRYSRHPNYFFEWLIWVSFFFFALPAPWGWTTILCPALMLFFLLRVTGIPYTEEQSLRSRGLAYRQYQRSTSAFVPWFPK